MNGYELVSSIVTLIFTCIVTPLMFYILNKKNNKTNDKVDEYHKQVNGKMGELLETTKALGNAEGTATEKARHSNKPTK